MEVELVVVVEGDIMPTVKVVVVAEVLVTATKMAEAMKPAVL